MKKSIFKKHIASIIALYEITEEELFAKTKQREITDARQLLYYLCHDRKMSATQIKDYLSEHNFHTPRQSIAHGIRSFEERMRDDEDYIKVVNSLKNV